MTRVDPDTAEWLDGPALVAWLEEEIVPTLRRDVGESHARRLNEWVRLGGAAHYTTADRILTVLDLTLAMLPDDLWRASPRARRVAA